MSTTRSNPLARLSVGLSLLSADAQQITGTSRYVDELVREFAKRPTEIKVEVLCNEESIKQAEDWASPTVKVTQARRFRVGRSRWSRFRAISSGLVRPAPLANQFSKALLAVQYPLIIPLPHVTVATVVNLHDVQHHDYPEHFSRTQLAWRRVTYDNAARRASLTLTLSEHSRAKIIEHVGIEPDRVVPIGLAVDHARFRPEPAPDEEERLDGLELPRRFLFYPASLWPHKNHIRLISALARSSDRDVHLVLSGATFNRLEPLMAAAEAKGVGERVHHFGFIPELALPAVYRRAVALVFPSTYEGFGTPPIEAMACGCPVASSRAASLAEVCGEAALELNPFDVDQMAAALDRVVGDCHLQATLRESGFEQANKFSWTSVADAHMTAYRRAIEIGPR